MSDFILGTAIARGATAFVVAAAIAATATSAAVAADETSIVHPIYARMPDAPQNQLAHQQLMTVADHYKLQPVEIIGIDPPAAPQTAAALKNGVQLVQKLAFAEALRQLDVAASDAVATGGAGLSNAELSDLYLNRGMAVARADWKPERSVDEATRARAYEDYVRAATLTPDRVLNARETPPQVLEDWRKAVEEVRGRPRGTLAVRGSAQLEISLDGQKPLSGSGGVTFKDLPYGDHLLHVDEPGRAPWGATVLVNAPSADLVVPGRAALTLDDRIAAAHANRMGTKFALVAELKLGEGPAQIELRLIDVTGIRHDATIVPLMGESGSIDAAVMRLDEEARRIEHLGLAPGGGGMAIAAPDAGSAPGAPLILSAAPPPASPTFRDNPAGWARDHWPLVTAVGVMVGAMLTLSLTVAFDGGARR